MGARSKNAKFISEMKEKIPIIIFIYDGFFGISVSIAWKVVKELFSIVK